MLEQIKVGALFLSFALSLLHLRGRSPLYLKLFSGYLLIAIIIQYFASWLVSTYGRNTILYNFYAVFYFTFYLFVLKEVISSPRVKKIIRYILFIYPVLTVCNILFIQGIRNWNSVGYSLGSLLVVAFSIYYFYELFKRPQFTALSKEPAFWLCSGLLFFYACSFPFLGLANFVQNAPEVILRNLSTILTLLNIFLYTSFIIAFLCRWRVKKTTA